MPITATQVGLDDTWGSRKSRTFSLAFSGDYATGGEAVTKEDLGFPNKIERVVLHEGVVGNGSDALALSAVLAADGSEVTILAYVADDTPGDDVPLIEYGDEEAYPSDLVATITVTGY